MLSWSTDSYVPNDYQGKALPTTGSTVRVAAEPIKKLALDPDKLTYRWILDHQVNGNASGQGKAVFKFLVTKWTGDSHEVKLQILNQQGNILEEDIMTIKIANPELLLTRSGQDYALQNKLETATGQEIKFAAIPLFFHIKNLTEIDWQWTYDGQNLTSPDEKDLNILNLIIPEGNLNQVLEQNLKVSAANKNDQSQQSSVNLNLQIK